MTKKVALKILENELNDALRGGMLEIAEALAFALNTLKGGK